MKKKILICLLVCVGLFVGITTYADMDEGLQNPNYEAVTGYQLCNIETFVNDGVLTIPAGTEIYLYNNYYAGGVYNTDYVLASVDVPNELDSTFNFYYDSEEHILRYDSYSSLCEVDDTVQTGKKITTTEIITGSYNYDLDTMYYYNFSAIVPEGNIAADIINGTSTLFSSIGVMFVNIFTAAAGIVYNSNDGLTTVGWLMLIGLGIALFMFGLRFIKGLINKARAR